MGQERRTLSHLPLLALHTSGLTGVGCSWEWHSLAGFAGWAQGQAEVLGPTLQIIVSVPHSLGNTHRFYFLKMGHSGLCGRVFKEPISKENYSTGSTEEKVLRDTEHFIKLP